MKIATKKITLYILSFVFAICLGAFAFVSMGNRKTVNADDPTEVYLTIHHANPTQYQNNASNANMYWTSLCFLHTEDPSVFGVSSGASTGKDFSDITSKTTYTGSENTFSYTNANEWGWGANTSNSTFRFIYLKTANAPVAGDKIIISAGAWFITGGTINEKYILSEEVFLSFNGTAWLDMKPFALDGTDVWAGADQSGDNGAQLTAWGIANNGAAAAFPTSGTYAFLTAGGALASAATANQASGITGIKYNGTPINEISGAVVAEWINRLNLYVPYTSGIITIEKGTIVGSAYAADDYYFSLAPVSGKTYGRMTIMNFAETTSFSFGETTKGITWNGYNGSNIEINGIAASSAPETGVCNLISVTDNELLTHNLTNNLVYASAGKTILCDGTPLSEISGAYIAIAFGYVFIYVPSNDSIITVQEGTRLGQGYYVDKDYTYHFKKGSNQSSLCYLVDFDSNGGTEVADVYVHNGATVAAPTAPTKASVGNTDYTFGHWEDEGGDEFNFSTAITANTTLTATWAEVSTVNLTLNNIGGVQEHNNHLIGSIYYTAVSFNHGVSTGESLAYDFSHLGAEYSNTSLSYNWISGIHLGYVANTKSDNIFNFIYFTTASVPETGATITVKAGGWFTTGGTYNDKYVIEQDFSITFNGTAWSTMPSYYLWDSRDMSAPIRQVVESKDGDDFVYTMPTDLSFDGYEVFGFAITDNAVEYFYPAGGEHKSSASNLSVIAIVGSFDMASGASIRITTAETSGIRWTATVDAAAKGHVLYWGKEGTSFGTEISAEGFANSFDIKTKYWATDTSYNAVLSDINSDYYTTEFTAKAYVDVVYSNGTTSRIYADNTGETRTIAYVAGAALDDPNAEWSDRQAAILTAIAGR